MSLPDKYFGEQNLRLSRTLLDKQGEINQLKAELKQAEATIARVTALCAELMTIDPADLTRAQRRQLLASVGRAVLAALDQPGDQLAKSTKSEGR